jgi:hypothetical protein
MVFSLIHLDYFPLFYQAALQRMLAEYAGVFGGRGHELTQLDRFVDQPDLPYGLLLAPSGRGKTALLIHWLQQRSKHDPPAILFMAISWRFQTASAQGVLIVWQPPLPASMESHSTAQ